LKNLNIINNENLKKYAEENNVEVVFDSNENDYFIRIPSVGIILNGTEYQLPALVLQNFNSVILKISDAIISGKNLAVIHKGNLIASGYSHSFNWVEYGEFIISNDKKRCFQPKKECIDLEVSNNSFILGITGHFGHFFTDCLDRLILAKQANLDSKFFKYYSDSQPPSQINDLISLIHPEALAKLNFLDVNKNYYAKNLYISSLNSKKPAISSSSFLSLQKYIFNEFSFPNKNEKLLFIGRKDVKKRKVINQDEIINYLSKKSFEIFFPEENSLLESIRTFNSANLIIIVVGSSKFNLAFCRPGTKVICLSPEGYSENSGATSIMMRQICNLFKLDLFFCACKIVGQNLGLDSDLYINSSELSRAINIIAD
jgi:hypothetical protein